MNTRQKCIIATMIAMAVLSIWIGFQELPDTTPEPEITYMSPTLVLTATPTPTETPNTTATANMTATQTPTRRVTTGWQHGGGGRLRHSTSAAAPIPEMATVGLVGAGLALLYWKTRG